jgi:mRNA-degrading endonuclease RelE of RelBE toxin-antitoxin system
MKRVFFRPQAVRELQRLGKRDRELIEQAIERFAEKGIGDVKMLAGTFY